MITAKCDKIIIKCKTMQNNVKQKGVIYITNINVRLSDDERERLEMYCMSEDLTLSWVIRRAIKEFLDKIYGVDYD